MLQILLDLSILKEIPYSTLFMLGLAALISLLTTTVNRLFTNPEKARATRREVSEWNSELRQAQKSGDKKEMEKLMKKQQYIMQLQSKMMWQSMKVSFIFLIPLFLIWQLLGGFLGMLTPIAYLPGIGSELPIPIFSFSLLWWYLICSLLFGTIFSHLLGLTENA